MSNRCKNPVFVIRALCVVIAAAVMMAMLAGCEETSGSSLSVSPADVTIGRNISSFTLAVVSGTKDLSLPLEWRVTNPALGSIMQSSGYMAVYANAGQVGVNTITARDQYGSEGFAVVTHVAYSTEQPAAPSAPVTPDTDTDTDGDTDTNTSTTPQLSVSDGEPAIAVAGWTDVNFNASNAQYNSLNQVVSYNFTLTNQATGDSISGQVFNIQRNTQGDTIAYSATINGQTYNYPD